MRVERRFCSIALAVGLGVSSLTLAGCQQDRSVNEDVLRIGAVLPLTGSLAAYGNNAKNGIELAVSEIQAALDSTDTRGFEIELTVEDSQGEPATAVSALKKLISVNQVQAVIGDIASSATLAMAPIANRSQVVLLSPAASAPAITDAGEYVFRDWPSDDFEAAALVRYLQSKSYRRVSLIVVNNDYGQAMRRAITSGVQDGGGTVVATEVFPQNATDMRAQIMNLRSSNPDVIVLISYPADSAIFLRQYSELMGDVRVPIVSTSSFEDPVVLGARPAAAEGVVFTSPLPPDSTDSVVLAFRNSYEQRYGEAPGLVADYAYDAVRLIVAAAERAGGTEGPALRAALLTITDFRGASGNISFDENGDVLRPSRLRTVRGGQFVDLSGQ